MFTMDFVISPQYAGRTIFSYIFFLYKIKVIVELVMRKDISHEIIWPLREDAQIQRLFKQFIKPDAVKNTYALMDALKDGAWLSLEPTTQAWCMVAPWIN